jgi:hypothetical protein
MHSLTVVGRENDLLIVVNEAGERFTITIDQALIDQVRRSPTLGRPSRQQTSPKDIQAHIRRGLTAQQVADLTGEDVSYVQRFEGPVLAERDYVVEQARTMLLGNSGSDSSTTFGDLVGHKLDELTAKNVSWSAWREDSGWRVEVTFFEGDVEHKAQWIFDQRKHTLTPLNDDAAVLSTDEPIRGPLIPKLRAVPTAVPEDDEHFDTDVFGEMPLEHTGPLLEPVPYGRTVGEPATADDDNVPTANTADLLEVLRRRRGEREPAPDHDAENARSAHPSTGSIRLVDHDGASEGASIHSLPGSDSVVEDDDDDDFEPEPENKPSGSRKNRPEMPSWDDIVFGTRSDDDPA